jgi:hypothetical protein
MPTTSAKYRIHNAPSFYALEQAARVGSNMAIVYSIGPCSSLTFDRDPATGRCMDEFPIYFDDYPKVAELRRSADAAWLAPLRRHLHAMCDRAVERGMKPIFHLYEPMLPWRSSGNTRSSWAFSNAPRRTAPSTSTPAWTRTTPPRGN